MASSFIYVLLGFMEGFVLILSPCILPIIPLFLAASMRGSKFRILGVALGFVVFFTVVLFFSQQLVNYLGIYFNWLRQASYLLLALLGLILISDRLSHCLAQSTQKIAQIGGYYSARYALQPGFISALFLGGLIALVWTPCAGPILAAVIVQTLTQKTNWLSFLTLFSFALGATIPLMILSLYGHILISTFHFFKRKSLFLRRVLGLVLIVTVLYLAFFERFFLSISTTPTGVQTSASLQEGLWRSYPAPPIGRISTWLNSPPLKIKALKGKVILVDFWTYSCINCLRTIPYLNDWYQRYREQGLIIIGVHSPEFVFEKEVANVQEAVKRYRIDYPVALDNQLITWRNYRNHYWPAHYLVDKKGNVVYRHFGEGNEAVTENNIRFLLGIKQPSSIPVLNNTNISFKDQTPEIYLGYERAHPTSSPNLIHNTLFNYSMLSFPALHAWSLKGAWQASADHLTAKGVGATLRLHFKARKVYMVVGNETGTAIELNIRLKEKSAKKMQEKQILVTQDTIYEVVSLPQFREAELEVIVSQPGVRIYTFSFGQ